jgi:hypothetical protein
MPPLEAFGPSVAIGLILFVMLWFALGTQRNIRKGNALLRWLQGGLPILGRRTTMRWLGSSAVELGIVEPQDPFREATVVVVLEPRDVPLLWAFARSRGRRDFVIIRANLVRAPAFSMDIRDPRGWTGRPDEADGEWRDSGGGTVALMGPGADDALIEGAWDRLSGLTVGVWRLSVQQVVPHLVIHFRPPVGAGPGARSEHIVGPIRDLARKLSGS